MHADLHTAGGYYGEDGQYYDANDATSQQGHADPPNSHSDAAAATGGGGVGGADSSGSKSKWGQFVENDEDDDDEDTADDGHNHNHNHNHKYGSAGASTHQHTHIHGGNDSIHHDADADEHLYTTIMPEKQTQRKRSRKGTATGASKKQKVVTASGNFRNINSSFRSAAAQLGTAAVDSKGCRDGDDSASLSAHNASSSRSSSSISANRRKVLDTSGWNMRSKDGDSMAGPGPARIAAGNDGTGVTGVGLANAAPTRVGSVGTTAKVDVAALKKHLERQVAVAPLPVASAAFSASSDVAKPALVKAPSASNVGSKWGTFVDSDDDDDDNTDDDSGW